MLQTKNYRFSNLHLEDLDFDCRGLTTCIVLRTIVIFKIMVEG